MTSWALFSSLFTDEDTTNSPVPRQMCEATISPNSIVTEEMFRKKFASVNNGAPSPDNITKGLLLELEDVVAQPHSIIFNKSLSTGEVPDDWRFANVPLVSKKRSRATTSNYRPISLTSALCKLLESLICEVIVRNLTDNKALRASKHKIRVTPVKSHQLAWVLGNCNHFDWPRTEYSCILFG